MNITFNYQRSAIIILAIVYVIITSILTSLDGGDFNVYLDAARKFFNHQNIYTPPFERGLQYYYSPFFALVLIPFANHVFLTEVVWCILSYFLLYRSYLLIQSYFDFSQLSKKSKRTWQILTLILSIQFILYNVSMIQITFFIFWAILESINYISRGKFLLGGIILGLAINIKLMPLLILPYLFYRGQFKALFTTIATFIILLFLPSVFLGIDTNNYLLAEWWKIVNPGNKEHLFETGIGTHSIVALIPVYLTDTIGELNFKRNLLNLNHQLVEHIINIIRLIFLATSLLYLRTIPFTKENDKLKSIWEISYFIILIPLLMPHQQKYNFILAIPMIAYLLYFFINTIHKSKSIGYYIALCTFILCMLFYSPIYGSDVIGKFLFLLTQHYRVLTIATILLIPISLYLSPGRYYRIINKLGD